MYGVRWPLVENQIRRGLRNHTYGAVRMKKLDDGTLVPRAHQGWDFYAPVGTVCFAIADGKVASVKYGGDYGTQIVIELDSIKCLGHKIYVMYAHLNSIRDRFKKVGAAVRRGEIIGETGKTGNARNLPNPADCHLHFELRTMVDAPQGDGKNLSTSFIGRISPGFLYTEPPLTSKVFDFCAPIGPLSPTRKNVTNGDN